MKGLGSKPIGSAGGLALLACLLTAASAQQSVKVGASLSLTGTYAPFGQNMQRGYQLCVKHTNAKGGVLGRKIELIVYDDRSEPKTAVGLYEKIIIQDKVDAILGPYSSVITEAVADVNEKYRMPMIAPKAAATSIFKKGRKFIFMADSPAEVNLEGLIDLAAQNRLKTIGLIGEDTLFPKAVVKGAIELAKKKGLHVVFVEVYPKGSTDFSAILAKVRAANPDVLGGATYFDDAVVITRQMKALNVNPKMYGLTVGVVLPRFYEVLGRDAEFVYGATQWEPELPYPGAREFVESHKREFPGADLSHHTASGYAGCQLLVEAIKRAGSLDGEKIRRTVLEMGSPNPLTAMYTVYGVFKITEDGLQIGHRIPAFQWQDGKKVIVWPAELAKGKPRFPTPPWTQR